MKLTFVFLKKSVTMDLMFIFNDKWISINGLLFCEQIFGVIIIITHWRHWENILEYCMQPFHWNGPPFPLWACHCCRCCFVGCVHITGTFNRSQYFHWWLYHWHGFISHTTVVCLDSCFGTVLNAQLHVCRSLYDVILFIILYDIRKVRFR